MGLYAQILRTSGGPSGTAVYGQMSVCIFDDTTNQPANGNNCEVTYQQNINGVTNQYSVLVPGTSVPIWTGELSNTDPAHPYFTQFTVISLVESTGQTVNPIADDLAFIGIVTTPTSAIGATDGTVKLLATSSFQPVQYSLDNVNWQTNPLFTNQPGGVGTGYVKDANGGFLSKPYTVDFLGKVLVSDPGINLGNGNISNWNAAFNPVVFTFQRRDFEVTSVVSGNFSKIKASINADLTGVSARSTNNGITSPGDLVYINTAKYKGTFEVLQVDPGQLTLDCPYTSSDTLGFVNINSLKPYYQVQMQLTYVDPVSGNFITTTGKFYPNSDGSIKADISSLLQTLLQAKDNSDYSLTNYRDMQLSASYMVQYAEVWTGGLVYWTQISRPYYVIYAAKQLGDNGGGNLVDYVPYLLGFQPAKWLNDFTMPVYSPGFPFDLPFIFSEYMVGLAPFYNITLLDINKAPLSVQVISDSYLLNEDGSFQLNQDGSKFIIAAQSLVDVPIVEQVGLNRLLIDFDLPDNCYYFKVQLRYTSGGQTYNLTQPITCRVNKDIPDQPVYLRWIGLNGSWNYYKFAYNQQVGLDVSDAQVIKNYLLDWQNTDTLEDVISKNAVQKMQVFAENVSVDDIKGLQSIKYSPKVQILTNQALKKWQTVIVATGSFAEYETFLPEYPFSITFNLPSINLQTQ